MGSEHYCLRWNNHQSNLLGVFSQLLQDEALVDVTLACEGHSLRAHKVVLSACSAYFHGLFAAHPDRHPIVILHDAKFSELRTLVDFMYRGEVNVEYGRLSGLLRTAESLKVKGLAETTESSRGEGRGARPSPSILGPPSSAAHVDGDDDAGRPSPSATSAASPPMANPLPDSPPSPPATTSSGERRSHAGRGESSPPGDNSHSPPRSKRSRGRHGSGGSGGSGVCLGDVRGATACHREGLGGVDTGDPVTEEVATPGVASPPAPSPPAEDPIPGPSGLLLPVQRVPLSLKKEVDWDRASADDKSATGESSSEYRHPHDSELPSETVLKETFLASTIGNATDDLIEYGRQPERASLAFTAPRLPLPNPTQYHHSLSKRIPFSFTFNRTLLPSSVKLPEYPLDVSSKDDCKSVAPDDLSTNPASESHTEPVLHHFLSSMSNFAYSSLAVSPESSPNLVGKENTDYLLCSSSKNDNALGKEYEGYLKCSICNSFMKTRTELSHHMESHSLSAEERKFEEESFSGREITEKPFRCDQCGQSYKYGSAYARHREQDHRARPPAEKPFRCDACGMRFRYLKSFKKHRLNHTLDRLRSKNYSSKNAEMASREEVTPSPWRHLGKDEKEETTVKEWENLNDREVDENRLEDEVTAVINETEPGQQQWLLSWPGRRDQSTSFPGKSEINAQDETNITSASTPDTSQLWELLLRTSTSSQNVAIPQEGEHEEEESTQAKDGGGRSYLDCPFCRKSFRSRENLRLHVRKHTGERPFECSVCGRAFGGKSDMTRHLRIHTGERPYRCHVCSKRFARADYLSKHLTTHLH